MDCDDEDEQINDDDSDTYPPTGNPTPLKKLVLEIGNGTDDEDSSTSDAKSSSTEEPEESAEAELGQFVILHSIRTLFIKVQNVSQKIGTHPCMYSLSKLRPLNTSRNVVSMFLSVPQHVVWAK